MRAIAALFGVSGRHTSPNAPSRGIPPMLPEHPAFAKIAELGKAATTKKKTDPDGALRLLAEIERLQRDIPMHPKVILDTRLRMATTLYESGRFDEAEKLLLAELTAARRMKISRATAAPHPDFERNLYCLAIYSKLRTLYTKVRRYDQALVFAMAEAYAKYENSTHNEYCDNPAPDFTTVEKLLRQLKSENDIPQWKAFLLEYTKPEPTCDRCWAMIDAIAASIDDANDQQITGK